MGATGATSPDELMTAPKRYLRESNESKIVVASRIGVNHHTLSPLAQRQAKPNERQIGVDRVLPQAC